MKDRDSPVQAAFREAADNLMGWREQQWAAMTEKQRKDYERLEADHRRRRKERADEFYRNKEVLAEREKTRLMLQRPELVLRMLPGRLKERRAKVIADRTVQGRHQDQLRVMEDEKKAALDGYMKRAEAEREKVREAAVKEKFAEAVRGLARSKRRERERDGGQGERER